MKLTAEQRAQKTQKICPNCGIDHDPDWHESNPLPVPAEPTQETAGRHTVQCGCPQCLTERAEQNKDIAPTDPVPTTKKEVEEKMRSILTRTAREHKTPTATPKPNKKEDKPMKTKKAGKAPKKAEPKKAGKATAKKAEPKKASTAERDEFGFRKGSLSSQAVKMLAGGKTMAVVRKEFNTLSMGIMVAQLEKNGFSLVQASSGPNAGSCSIRKA